MSTHFPNGVTNVTKESTFGDLKQMSPSKYTVYWNDFVQNTDLGNVGNLNAAEVSSVNWTCTKVDGGGAVSYTHLTCRRAI